MESSLQRRIGPPWRHDIPAISMAGCSKLVHVDVMRQHDKAPPFRWDDVVDRCFVVIYVENDENGSPHWQRAFSRHDSLAPSSSEHCRAADRVIIPCQSPASPDAESHDAELLRMERRKAKHARQDTTGAELQKTSRRLRSSSSMLRSYTTRSLTQNPSDAVAMTPCST